ncbi:hypothetical protein STANM309S_02676 [Streptomyces tanashiensis]
MNTPPSPSGSGHRDTSPVRLGALVPLTRPGWVEAGRHLLAGLELAAGEVNDAGGIDGRPLELLVRDTAADPERAAAAVDELAGLGVAAVVGEYHSVVARAAAARADALGVPFLCSSAVLDALTEERTDWVARLAPASVPRLADLRGLPPRRRPGPDRRGHPAERLLGDRHAHPAGAPRSPRRHRPRTRRQRAHARGPVRRARRPRRLGAAPARRQPGAGRALRQGRTGRPAARGVADRRSGRAAGVRRGGPLRWARTAPESRSCGTCPSAAEVAGDWVCEGFGEQWAETSSSASRPGSATVLAAAARSAWAWTGGESPESWSRIAVEGTRGPVRFSRAPGLGVWQWTWAPIQVVDRDPSEHDRFRVLHAG